MYISVIVSPAIYFHFVSKFLKLNNKYFIVIVYAFSVLYLLVNIFRRDLFLQDLRYVFNQFYWHDWLKNKSIIWLSFYISYYVVLLPYSFCLLIKEFIVSKGEHRNRIKYFIVGTMLGWIGPESCLLADFHINIYPYGNFLIAIYTIVIAYAIFRHQLMDINIAFKNGLVYSTLVAFITILYFIFVIALGKLFQGLTGIQSFWVNLSAMIIVAILFNPLRDWIQRILDRKFFQGTLESLAMERQKLQQELFHKEKLAYVGRLASQVVHEIRNPLTSIETFVKYVPEKCNDPEFLKKFKTLIPSEIGRIKRVIASLLDLARPNMINFVSLNVVDVIDSTLSLLEEQVNIKKIKVIKEYYSNNVKIKGDKDALRQVFLNLFLNSIQALSEGGSVSVSIKVIENPRKSELKFLPAGKAGVRICVEDTGKGIPKEILDKLFTPFMTTKEDGIGLGLPITQEIIKAHGGSIEVESEVGVGTKFVIKLSNI